MRECKIQFRALSSSQKIDREAGIIYGVSVMTIGPARGHGLTIDETGLKQCLAACEVNGDEGVKLVINHDSGFEEIVGAVKNFRIEGDQLFGDAHILDTATQRERIFELAEKMPGQFGLSVETTGKHEAIKGSREMLYRCSGIDAIALVPTPAANKRGLFSKVDTDTNNMDEEAIKEAVAGAVAEAVPAAVTSVVEEIIEPVKEEMKKFSARLSKFEEGDEKPEGEEPPKNEDDKLAKLAAAAAAEAIKKLGISSAPRSADAAPSRNGKLTKFEQKVEELTKLGTKNPYGAAVNRHPDLYEEYRVSLEKGGN